MEINKVKSKEFTPIELSIKIESLEELKMLCGMANIPNDIFIRWSRLDKLPDDLAMTKTHLWRFLDNIVKDYT